ncbi:hypothetical protein HZS_6324 [Henneguya salminicola]|nr:hypothetical protein HZS_6324 [Henneguya salminicola]
MQKTNLLSGFYTSIFTLIPPHLLCIIFNYFNLAYLGVFVYFLKRIFDCKYIKNISIAYQQRIFINQKELVMYRILR